MIFKELISASTKIRIFGSRYCESCKGSFTNYVDKKRWVGSPKMSILGQCVEYEMSL